MKTVLFEPWHLGDAVIATSVAELNQKKYTVACNSLWIPILRLLSPNTHFLKIDAHYILGGGGRFTVACDSELIDSADYRAVVSIRGDIRDFLLARRLFGMSKLQFRGWIPFLARRVGWINIPFKYGWMEVENRYRRWCDLLKIDFSLLESAYRKKVQKFTSNQMKEKKLNIHIGARWQSRQYPFVLDLKNTLVEHGWNVQILAESRDSYPKGLRNKDIKICVNEELLNELNKRYFLMTNDSASMHIGGMNGNRVVVISRVSDIREWIPPLVTSIRSSLAPLGYMPDISYASNKTLSGWEKPETIIEELERVLLSSV